MYTLAVAARVVDRVLVLDVHGLHTREAEELLEQPDVEVAHTQGPDLALVIELLHLPPGGLALRAAPPGRVQHVDVDVVQPHDLQLLLEAPPGRDKFAALAELRHDADLLAGHRRVPNRPPHLVLVGVALRGVDVAVAGLQRPEYLYIYIYIYTYTYVHIYICAYIYIYVYIIYK